MVYASSVEIFRVRFEAVLRQPDLVEDASDHGRKNWQDLLTFKDPFQLELFCDSVSML